MAAIHLVRHGEPLTDRADPDLSELGHAQARAVADRLAGLGPLAVVSSPLWRARSTAAPLAARWGVDPVIEPTVRELPSPSAEPAARAAWLRWALELTFAELDDLQRGWRDAIVAYLGALERDTVVFSHAVVINAVVGHCAGDDRVLAFVPAHTSVTTLSNDGGRLRLVERGEGRDHRVS